MVLGVTGVDETPMGVCVETRQEQGQNPGGKPECEKT